MFGKLKPLLIISIGVLIIYFVFSYLRKKELNSRNIIYDGYGITRGVVVKVSRYKGRTVRIKYCISKNCYTDTDEIVEDDNVTEGDSVYVKYSLKNPEIMISELNNEF